MMKIFLLVFLFSLSWPLGGYAQDRHPPEQPLGIDIAVKAAAVPQIGINLYPGTRAELGFYFFTYDYAGGVGDNVQLSANALLRSSVDEQTTLRYGLNGGYNQPLDALTIGPLLGIDFALGRHFRVLGDLTFGFDIDSGAFTMGNTGVGVAYRIR
ncbi:MAG TPA: hypothetical protein VFG50_04525 [Rhodothermales bacterium]|nr:hypothetical protein [Rhodothermales bacterium]